MNITNNTNPASAPFPESKDPWTESGSMVYVALTVATMSALTMCCIWFFKQKWLRETKYNTVNEEDVELTANQDFSDDEEEISLGIDNKEAFTIDDHSSDASPEESSEDGEEEQLVDEDEHPNPV